MNMNFDFNNPTRLIFGSGKLSELAHLKLPGTNALLLMSNGKSAKISGAYEQMKDCLVKSEEYQNIKSNLQNRISQNLPRLWKTLSKK